MSQSVSSAAVVIGALRVNPLLTNKAPPIICSIQQCQILLLFENNKYVMIFHENRLLADDSHEISYLFFPKIKKDVTKFVVCCSRDWPLKS